MSETQVSKKKFLPGSKKWKVSLSTRNKGKDFKQVVYSMFIDVFESIGAYIDNEYEAGLR